MDAFNQSSTGLDNSAFIQDFSFAVFDAGSNDTTDTSNTSVVEPAVWVTVSELMTIKTRTLT
jgi:hypothetical protein